MFFSRFKLIFFFSKWQNCGFTESKNRYHISEPNGRIQKSEKIVSETSITRLEDEMRTEERRNEEDANFASKIFGVDLTYGGAQVREPTENKAGMQTNFGGVLGTDLKERISKF